MKNPDYIMVQCEQSRMSWDGNQKQKNAVILTVYMLLVTLWFWSLE